jgi:hypothetical protein
VIFKRVSKISFLYGNNEYSFNFVPRLRICFFIPYYTNLFLENSTLPLCPTNTANICNFSTTYIINADDYYGFERLYILCTQALSNITAVITVQKTVNTTFANQYTFFLEGTVNWTHQETSSQVIYTWLSNMGQIIEVTGKPYYVEAQFQLQGTKQIVSNDTYSFTAQIACSHQVVTQTGYF